MTDKPNILKRFWIILKIFFKCESHCCNIEKCNTPIKNKTI